MSEGNMTPEERGLRLGKIAAWVLMPASAAYGWAVGALSHMPPLLAWVVGAVATVTLIAFAVFASVERRKVEREEAAEKLERMASR